MQCRPAAGCEFQWRTLPSARPIATSCIRRFRSDTYACRCRTPGRARSEEHTSELQSLRHLVCRLLLEKKKTALRLSFSGAYQSWKTLAFGVDVHTIVDQHAGGINSLNSSAHGMDTQSRHHLAYCVRDH